MGVCLGFRYKAIFSTFLMNIDEVKYIYEMVIRALREQSRLFSDLNLKKEEKEKKTSNGWHFVVQLVWLV